MSLFLMNLKVKKRDGTIVSFDGEKICNAIEKAYREVYDNILGKIQKHQIYEVTEAVCKKLKTQTLATVSIEKIQDTVEYELMSVDKAVAKAYITYRYKRAMARDEYRQLMDAVQEKLTAKDIKNQNANVDEQSFGGRIGEMSDLVMKRYALDYCMSEKTRRNHLENRIYTHDLSHYAVGDHNCMSIPFDDLLKNGFNTRQTDVRPAQSVNTAFQLIAVISQLQSLQQFGGVSATHLDWTMVPYVRKSFMKHYIVESLKEQEDFLTLPILAMEKEELDEWVSERKEKYLKEFGLSEEDFYFANDKLDEKLYRKALFDTIVETYQAVEGMYHNLNTLQSRSGNQLPFTSVNYGTCTLPEGRLVIGALLDTSIKGIGKLNKTSVFPCGIFQLKKDVNRKPGDPNYHLFRKALKSTSLRLYPNYCNVDWSGNAGYDENDPRTYFSTMGCRTANGWDINGFGQLKDGRGNICPVTIILPTLAMEAVEQAKELTESNSTITFNIFLEILNNAICDAKDTLIERFEWICSQKPESAKFMYENNIMAGYDGKDIRSALKHGTLAIGQLGLAEALQIILGTDHTTEDGMKCAKVIERLFKERCASFKEKYKLNFGVYYTPAENLCHTAMQKFKEKYGVIQNVSDKEFFTNSMHVPVWNKMTPFEKIDIESQLTGYSSAGCITYVELDESAKHNIDALETLVNYAMDKDIPYFAINVPNDMCTECGYTDEISDKCPKCGSENIRRLRRVTGYLTNDYKTAFNKGKQQEVEMRVKHE